MIHINGNRGYIGSYLKDVFKTDHGTDLCWFDKGRPQDIQDFSWLETGPEIDVILHFAGYSSEPMCTADQVEAWDNNVEKFRMMIEDMSDDKLLIYASSASVYAQIPEPATEQSATSSIRPYDCTKVVCDTLAEMYINQGKKIVGLRLGTVAGLSRIQRIDTIVNAMTKSALDRRVVSCVDPEVRRSILFLPDLAKAIQLIINNPVPGIYNLGSLDTTVGEIAETISTSLDAGLIVDDRRSNFYDFHLNCDKFISQYGDFRETSLGETVFNLYDGLPYVKQGRRDVAQY